MMSKSKRGKKRREVGYFLIELESKRKVSEEGREVINLLIKLTTEGEMGKGEREVINCIIMYVVYLREYLHELVAEREVS